LLWDDASVAKNDIVLLDGLLDAQAAETPSTPADEVFEAFACEQILKDQDLSLDQVESGRVGGSDDGGLDGVFCLLEGSLVEDDADVLQDDFDMASLVREPQLELYVIQAKQSPSFAETPFDKAHAALRDLLDLGKTVEGLETVYSAEVIERCDVFRRTWRKLAARHPAVTIRFVYASKGDTATVNDKVQAKAERMRADLTEIASNVEVETTFVGARQLLELATREKTYTLKLPYTENITAGTSHVALVSLRDYYAFITDEGGGLRKYIFDGNVRDYQGAVEVNKGIRESLEDPDSPEFWWLNNGITVICSAASSTGKLFALDDVQIVNGLQTSHTLYNHLSREDIDSIAVDGSVVVRIIVTDDPATRDAVIRATNRQTNVSTASLRATDDLQRDIERFFASKGWYYDRRKNFYKNQGRSTTRIVSIPFLAQAMIALGFSEPDNSRARPSSLLKQDSDYSRIFSTGIRLEVYLWVAMTQRAVDLFLKGDTAEAGPAERSNLRFYVSMVAVGRHLDGRVHHPAQLGPVLDEQLTEEELETALDSLRTIYKQFAEENGGSMDKTAKSRAFRDAVLAAEFPDSEAEQGVVA
jgi:hypothetical protein